MVYQARIGSLCSYERLPADQDRKTSQGEISMTISLDATEYTFQGEGITASYYPDGAGGPIVEGVPETFFVYQDSHLSKTFGQADVSIQQVGNVAALVSVVLAEGPLLGGPVTTFTVLIPSVGVTEGSPQSFRTKSITTVQAATLVQRTVFPALQTYKVEHLDGTASVHALRDVAAGVSSG
jgi:hypothetical protein